MKTYLPKVNLDQRKWHVINAEGAVLGRLAAQVADILRGKNKPVYTPHLDAGDFVVVINAEKVRLTGKKLGQKLYRRHSGFPGGLRSTVAKDFKAKRADRMVEEAIRGMLPKNKLGRAMVKKLKVYTGPAHPHAAQQPGISGIIR